MIAAVAIRRVILTFNLLDSGLSPMRELGAYTL
jgi:hypothetical protein